MSEPGPVSMLDAALAYADQGFAVFPVHSIEAGACSCGRVKCDSSGKHPRTDNGLKEATTDPDTIRGWWAQWPHAGIAWLPGRNRVALDVDVRDGRHGPEELQKMMGELGVLPETVKNLTRSGGFHLVFSKPEDLELRGQLSKGIDLRGNGKSYIILPPTPGYKWEPYCDPEEQPFAPLPAAWLRAIAKNGAGPDADTHTGVNPEEVLKGVPEGERDEKLFRFASYLRGEWIPRNLAEPLVLVAARASRPPFPDADAIVKVEQAWKYPAGRGRANPGESKDPTGQLDGPLEKASAPAKVSAIFEVITGRELLALSLPPRESVLGPFHADEAVLLYARRGVGKTLAALGAAAAIAGGGEFLQWKASRPRKVLYVDGELTARKVQERVKLATGMLAGGSEDALDNLTVLSAGINRRSPNIATEEGRRAIEEHLAGVGYLILDALSTLCRSGEENAAESWQPVQDWIVTLRAQGVPSMTLHHAGKSGLQRGTSKREDIYDWILALKHPNDYQTHQGARFEVHFEKTRDFPGGTLADPFEARIDHDGPRDFWTIKTLEVALEEKVISLHRDGFSNGEIVKEVQRHKSTVSRILKRAEKEGRLTPAELA